MKPAAFSYERARSVDAAVAALARDPDAKVLAGGQSLVPMMNMRLARPSRLVDLNELYLTASTPEEQVPVDDALMIELESLAKAEGKDSFHMWVGSENYEMRVGPGARPPWIDRRILAIIRGEQEGQNA